MQAGPGEFYHVPKLAAQKYFDQHQFLETT
jgi:hypothetical protein